MRNSRLVGAVLLSSLVAACGSGGSQQHATALASQAAADRSSAQAAASQAAQDRAAAEVLASQAAKDKAAAAATSKATEAKATAAAAAAAAKTAAEAAKTAEAKATAMKVEAAAAKAAEAKATATKTAAAAATAAEAVKAAAAAAAVTPTATPVAGAPSAVAIGDSGQTPFDKQYAETVAKEIVDSIKTVDGYLKDGIAVDSGLSTLSPEYGYLENAGVPPGVRASDYIPRLRTLGSFAQQAADLYIDKPTEALAKYTVLRAETKPVLDQVNAATGSHFKLPS